MISQGEVWWAELGDPIGSTPGYRRPVVIVQGDALNRSRLATALCVPLTTNPRWADLPGNVLLRSAETGLDRDSVANVTLTLAVDRSQLADLAGHVSTRQLDQIIQGVNKVMGR